MTFPVTPAQAGAQLRAGCDWTPAFAGVTGGFVTA